MVGRSALLAAVLLAAPAALRAVPQQRAPPSSYSSVQYVGYTDTAADIKGRLAVMEAALEASLTAPDLDTSNSTLKIFLAPEFFFRGPAGAYSAEDPALMALGDSLRSMVGDT